MMVVRTPGSYVEMSRARPMRSDAPRVDVPTPGFYRYRTSRMSPWQAVLITYGPAIDPLTGETLDRSPMYAAIVNGEPTSVDDVWPNCSGEPISEDDYNFILADHRHAVLYRPDAPEAKPRERVDLNKLRPVF